MAARIEKEVGYRSDLLPGNNGIFDVIVDGNIIYSKHQAGKFPEEQEVIILIKNLK
ncbi:MAG: Rdx family protein [Nitrospiraceae bacterium]|nr:Rdx family protein [Nitrospiraceae bacterium]